MVKKTILPLLILLLVTAFSGRVSAQDPHFSQFYANPLYLNPAFAGTNVCPRVIMNYRNQWPSITGAFITYNAGYDQYFSKLSGGLGLLAMSDRAGEGALQVNSIGMMYAYHIFLDKRQKHNLNFALQATYMSKSLQWEKLTFGDMIDQKDGFIYSTSTTIGNRGITFVDFSAGALYYQEKFFAGFAVHHLTEPVNSFYDDPDSRLFRKYTAHVGLNIDIAQPGKYRKDVPKISPNLIYQQQDKFHQLNYGLYYQMTPIVAGLWIRHFISDPVGGGLSDAVIALVGFEYDKFKVGYTYDLTISQLTDASGGAHEFSFTLKFNCPTPGIKLRAIKCPVF